MAMLKYPLVFHGQFQQLFVQIRNRKIFAMSNVFLGWGNIPIQFKYWVHCCCSSCCPSPLTCWIPCTGYYCFLFHSVLLIFTPACSRLVLTFTAPKNEQHWEGDVPQIKLNKDCYLKGRLIVFSSFGIPGQLLFKHMACLNHLSCLAFNCPTNDMSSLLELPVGNLQVRQIIIMS